MIKLFNLFVKLTGFPVQFFCFRTKTYYEDKKVQSKKIKGKAIIICNHNAVYDFAVLMFVFLRRSLRCQIAEVTYDKNPVLKFLLKSLGGIRVDRTSRDFSFVGKSCKILERGGVVEIFPEARIPKPEEEKPLAFVPSAAYTALLSGAPIIPVYCNGKYFQKERTRVIIGKPINVRELYDDALDERQNLENISAVLREKTINLKNELERQVNEKSKKNKKKV